MTNITLERLQEIWEKIRKDKYAQKALHQLDQDGFPISHLNPCDPSFRQPSWADYIAAIPLVTNRPSRRRLHSKATLRKHWPLVRAIRHLAQKVDDGFSEVYFVTRRDINLDDIARLRKRLLETADWVENFLSWDWYTRDKNRRNALIAELRWTIRHRTGRPHDHELNVLIDAAFRAAGLKKGPYLDPATLDRIEKREKESRVKAAKRLRSRIHT
jgi:hypothetical protein